MQKVVFSGVFDPVTIGHLNLIERISKLYPEVLVAVAQSSSKNPKWDLKQRTLLMQTAVEHLDNVTVMSFSGLLVDFLKTQNANIIIRGIRSVIDWSYEQEMAQINQTLMPHLETLFLPAKHLISSTYVRQIWELGGDISAFVPAKTLEILKSFGQ